MASHTCASCSRSLSVAELALEPVAEGGGGGQAATGNAVVGEWVAADSAHLHAHFDSVGRFSFGA
jgi:hypothetical protein